MTEPVAVVHTRLTKEEAGQAMTPGDVWSEDLQRFVPRGQQFAIDAAKREADPAYQLTRYEERRATLLKFVSSKLQQAEYDARGYPLKGGMHDYYILPGYDKKTATKGGASKIAGLLRLRVAKKRVTAATFTADHGSARVSVELVDANGQPAGAHEAACSTAEMGFQSDGVRRKYGARYEKGEEVSPPDYRAAENDVVSRAGKRAFVGAVIVAAALEEVFDLEASTDAAGEEGQEQRAAKRAAAPKPARGQHVIRLPGTPDKWDGHGGQPIADVPLDVLRKVRTWLHNKDAAKNADLVTAIDEELEARRAAEADAA